MAANSTGPVPVDNPWDAFADDQLGLMDHLGIREFFYMGYCIGGCFAGKLLQRAPDRVVAAVFCQTVGHRPEDPTVMYRHSKENWVPDFLKRRPDVSTETIEKYLHNLYAAQPDFLYSVSRDFIRNCRTPMLVLPDDVPAHPLQTSIDVASLAPNAEITVYPVEGTGGAEATHDRPGAPFPQGTDPDARRRAIVGGRLGWGNDQRRNQLRAVHYRGAAGKPLNMGTKPAATPRDANLGALVAGGRGDRPLILTGCSTGAWRKSITRRAAAGTALPKAAARRPRAGPLCRRHLTVIHALLVGGLITQALLARPDSGQCSRWIGSASRHHRA